MSGHSSQPVASAHYVRYKHSVMFPNPSKWFACLSSQMKQDKNQYFVKIKMKHCSGQNVLTKFRNKKQEEKEKGMCSKSEEI